MIEPTLYDMIFKRKSVRKFSMAPLPAPELEGILAFVNSAKSLAGDLRTECHFLHAGEVKNLLPIKAPHYLCLYSEPGEHSLLNAGYLLQQVDLYLSSRAIGSCWLGLAKPNRQVALKRNGLDFVIMLALGPPLEPVHRERASEFRRKPMDRVTDLADSKSQELLEAVRLAPSASNSQPWFVTGDDDGFKFGRDKLGLIKSVLYDKMNLIDMGIALCHFELALKQQDKSVRHDFQIKTMPAGVDFVVSVYPEV